MNDSFIHGIRYPKHRATLMRSVRLTATIFYGGRNVELIDGGNVRTGGGGRYLLSVHAGLDVRQTTEVLLGSQHCFHANIVDWVSHLL